MIKKDTTLYNSQNIYEPDCICYYYNDSIRTIFEKTEKNEIITGNNIETNVIQQKIKIKFI